jgi:hypothetical protein
LEFVAEALFFVIIVAISAWPIFAAAGALQEFFPARIELRSSEPVGDIRASLTPCFCLGGEACAGQTAEVVSRSLGRGTFLKQGVKEAT